MDPIKTPPALRYTPDQSERANYEWNATCGPHSIAAACELTLDEVKRGLIDYKGWMSPTQVGDSLRKLGKLHTLQKGLKVNKLCIGINRVQWEGPWLKPSVPARVAYQHTHYVAYHSGHVLCTVCDPHNWITASEWREMLKDKPFHITHHFRLIDTNAKKLP